MAEKWRNFNKNSSLFSKEVSVENFLSQKYLPQKFLVATFFQKQPSRGVHIKRCSENMQQIYRRTPMTGAIRHGCSLVNLLHICCILATDYQMPGGTTVFVWTLKKCFQIFSHFRKTLTTVYLVNIYLRNNRLNRLFSLVRVTWIDFRYNYSY